MLESFKNKAFNYTKLTEEEQQKRGILGRLKGVIADTKSPTRNGRKYSKELWENVFNDPIMQEKIKNRCCFGELCHPFDNRAEIDMEKIAVCLAETPKIGDDGNIYGVFDILNTPNGRILKSLCDYGCTVGVSSRGQGDVLDNGDGEEVDPSTYDCEGWDVVLVPAVEKARMEYVTESLDKNRMNLKKALSEDINKATEDEKRIMKESLKELGIIIDNDVNINKGGESKEETQNITTVAEGDGTSEVVKSLQESLKENSKLKAQLKSLQEQLAVRDTKVNKLIEEVEDYKSTTVRLSDKAIELKNLSEKVSSLEEKIATKDKQLSIYKDRNSKLMEAMKNSSNRTKQLNESVSLKEDSMNKLNEQLTSLKEENFKLNESLKSQREKASSDIMELKGRLSESIKLSKSYRTLANDVMSRYIDSRAEMLGVNKNEIVNKLNESYTIDDIDKACDDLQEYSININKLPFNVNRNVRMRVNESNEPITKYASKSSAVVHGDDDVDDDLLKLAGLK